MINTRIQEAAFGRTDRMTLKQFLLHIDYNTDHHEVFDGACPDRIHPDRWRAMLTWAKNQGHIQPPFFEKMY